MIGPRSWQYRLSSTTEGQYSLVELEHLRLISSLCISRSGDACLLNLPAYENKKKYTAYDRFHGNGPYRKDQKNIDQELLFTFNHRLT